MDPVDNPHELNQLHRAVLVGSAERTQAVLAGGTVDINRRNSHGATPLMMAVHNGHSRIAKILIEKGANVSMADKQGFTALHFCCAREEDDAIVKLLAKAGADLDAIIPAEGSTPLHRATHNGSLKVVRALIEAGANPDTQLPDGATALHIAAEEGQVAVMRELLRGKANPLLIQTFSSGSTTAVPLEVAADHGHSDIVRGLVQELGIEGCDATSAGVHALAFAASKQHLDIMAILTGAGVVDTGKALYLAAGMGHEASVKFLLRHRHKEGRCGVEDAYVNACEIDGNTPLVVCIQGCLSHAPRILRMLVDAGADSTSPILVMNLKGQVIFTGTPLAFTRLRLRDKIVAKGKPATTEHLHRLEAIRRLLLRVEAVHAVSWLWPSGAPFIGRATETDPESPLPALKLMLPILKRRTKRRGGLVATLLRYSVKT
ncbi:unnamed protein product [Ectocarpus sp. 4 AP-2014]